GASHKGSLELAAACVGAPGREPEEVATAAAIASSPSRTMIDRFTISSIPESRWRRARAPGHRAVPLHQPMLSGRAYASRELESTGANPAWARARLNAGASEGR